MSNYFNDEDVLLDLNLKRFPTHLPYTRNKVARNKYVKINGQTIYNGAMNRFSRNILMGNMHRYLVSKLEGLSISEFPIRVHLTINTVINHGDVQRRLNKKSDEYKISWKKADEDYEPSSDLDNIGWIWIKAFNDALQKAQVIPNDSLSYVKGYSVSFEEVEELDDRSLNFKLIKY